uniref:3-beta hydroxysteroid dehydrogenase/isomerase domain-containing protein n=1 Tax=Ananas comosus var. bracteatus TaxID=296719 RepID=A0A6V7Q756_ANACO|nr:unnamed protein product [Ananas comosus var. bracteatus]
MAISEPGPLAAEPNRIPFAVTFGRSSFLGRSLGAALVSPGHWTVSFLLDARKERREDRSKRGNPAGSGERRKRSSPPSPAPLSSSTSIPSPPPPPPPPLSPPPPPNFSELHALAIGATRTLISAAIECGVRRVVYTASAAVAFDGSRDVVLGDESGPYPDKVPAPFPDLGSSQNLILIREFEFHLLVYLVYSMRTF